MRWAILSLSLLLGFGCASDGDDTASNERPGSGGQGGSGGGTSQGDASFPESDGALAGAGGIGGDCLKQVSEEKIATGVISDDSVGFQPWSNPAYATTSDDMRATSPGLAPTRTTHRLVASGFGFSLPTGATIQGIELFVERSKAGLGTAQDYAIRLLQSGMNSPDNMAATAAWSDTDTEVVYGGPAALWGTTWVAAQISSADFGAFVRVQNTHMLENVNPRVDQIKIRVWYVYDACA